MVCQPSVKLDQRKADRPAHAPALPRRADRAAMALARSPLLQEARRTRARQRAFFRLRTKGGIAGKAFRV